MSLPDCAGGPPPAARCSDLGVGSLWLWRLHLLSAPGQGSLCLPDCPLASGFPVTFLLRRTCGDCTGPSGPAAHLFRSAGAALPGSGLCLHTRPPARSLKPPASGKGTPCRPALSNQGRPLCGQPFATLLLPRSKGDSEESRSTGITIATPTLGAPAAAVTSWWKPEPSNQTGRLGTRPPGY